MCVFVAQMWMWMWMWMLAPSGLCFCEILMVDLWLLSLPPVVDDSDDERTAAAHDNDDAMRIVVVVVPRRTDPGIGPPSRAGIIRCRLSVEHRPARLTPKGTRRQANRPAKQRQQRAEQRGRGRTECLSGRLTDASFLNVLPLPLLVGVGRVWTRDDVDKISLCSQPPRANPSQEDD